MDQSNNSAAPSTQSNTTPAIAGVAHNHPPPADSNNENSMISIADLNTIMKSQGISPASQAQIIGTLTNNNNNNQGGSSTVDMASVLAKIQVNRPTPFANSDFLSWSHKFAISEFGIFY